MDISGRDGQLACASVLKACPYPGKIIAELILLGKAADIAT